MSLLKIACIGDVMCGDSFNSLGWGVAASIDKYGNKFLSDEITNIFTSHNITLCNVESVLSDIGRSENSLRTLHMRGRPQTAAYLAEWGINVAHLANNHILEQGLEAAIDTVRQLEKVGIKTVGTDKDGNFQSGIRPLYLQLGDQSVVIIGACFHNDKYAFKSNLDEVLGIIRTESKKENNIVIVSVHWGDELIDRPSIWQRQTAKQFVDAGALLVIGHHPHVIQGIDSSNDALIAYSLGNFIFDDNYQTGWSIILSITITGKKIVEWQAIPVVINNNYQPMLADSQKQEEIRKELFRRCNLAKQNIVDAKKYQEEYLSELKSLESASRHKLWLNIMKNFTRYRLVHWPHILLRPVRRRLGMW
jgi:poly-gamma-glutamate synthesis protein (capsule biosynthesis protein)